MAFGPVRNPSHLLAVYGGRIRAGRDRPALGGDVGLIFGERACLYGETPLINGDFGAGVPLIGSVSGLSG